MRRPHGKVLTMLAGMALAVVMVGPAAPREAAGQETRSRGEQRRQAREPTGRMGMMQDREGMNETVMLVFLDQMRKSLSLTAEQTLELLPVFEEMEKLRHAHHKERRDQLRQLRELLDDPNTPDKAIEQHLEALRDSDEAFRTSQDKLEKAIDAKLSVRQKAQLMFFQSQFRDRLRRRVEEIQRGRAGRRPMGATGERPDRPRRPFMNEPETEEPPPDDAAE